MKTAIEVMHSRRSIRAYTPQPVGRQIIEEIVDCARLAPTAMNDQPWEFVVITEKSSLASIPKLLGHAEFIANAAFCVLVLARQSSCAVEDCCAATENLLLAAEAHGQARLVALLDNLGKGASGAAVQNLQLMLGLETTPPSDRHDRA